MGEIQIPEGWTVGELLCQQVAEIDGGRDTQYTFWRPADPDMTERVVIRSREAAQNFIGRWYARDYG